MLKGVPDFEMLREEQEEKGQLRREKRSSKCFKLEVTSAELAQPIFIQSDLHSFLDIAFLRSLSSWLIKTKTKNKNSKVEKNFSVMAAKIMFERQANVILLS